MDDLGKSIPAAESFIDAEQGGSKKQSNEYCLNCGTRLQDRFCHHCGQKDLPARQTLGELWTNFISSFWSYEGKFLQTTRYIITRPGYLTMEYNQGKRESYYHPARMYVFISFVFFLLFISLPDSDEESTTKGLSKTDSLDIAKIPNKGNQATADSTLNEIIKNIPDSADRAEAQSALANEKKKGKKVKKKGGISLTGSEYKSKEAYDSARAAQPEAKRDNWFEKMMNYKAIEINQRYKGDDSKFGEEFKKAFVDQFSKVLFWLLPFFALLLKLLYIRRDYFYSEHLVFSIYYYNFFYLAGSIKMLIEQVPWLNWLGTVIGFWIFFYLLFAMKRVYLQGWGKTIFKFLIFIFLFGVLMGVAFSISALSILVTF